MDWHIFSVPSNDAHKRVDALCKMIFMHTSFHSIMKWIRKGIIKVNNHKTSAHYRLQEHDTIHVAQSIAHRLSSQLLSKKGISDNDAVTQDTTQNLFSEDIMYTHNIVRKNDLLFLSKDILVYNKAKQELLFGKNSITHRLQEYYMKHVHTLAFKPAPCHRLDTGTSGIVICALHADAARTVSSFHKNNYIHKIYVALLHAPSYMQLLTHILYRNKKSKTTIALPVSPTIQKNCTPKEFSSDHYKMLGKASLWLHSVGAVDVHTRTAHHTTEQKLFPTVIVLDGSGGKTHQIRAQCAVHNTPLWGDVKYTPHTTHKTTQHRTHNAMYYLHASTVLCHAIPLQKQMLPMRIVAPIPKDWYTLVKPKDHFLLRRLENILDRVSLIWGKERPTDFNIDIIAWYSSTLGGVMG